MFRPMNDRVIIKRDEAESVSTGGILIPEQAKDIPVRGTIVRVGTGEKMSDGRRFPLNVSEGDRVIFSKLAGMHVCEEEAGDHLLIRECDILAVCE